MNTPNGNTDRLEHRSSQREPPYTTKRTHNLVEVAEKLATNVTVHGLNVIHDTGRGGNHQVTKLTRGKNVANPLIEVINGNIEARRDNTALVDAAKKSDNDLAIAVIVDDLVLTDVAVLLHDVKEAKDNLAGRADHHLTLAHLLSVKDALESISKNRAANHL